MATKTDKRALRRGSRVVTTVPLPGVPEGMAGTLGPVSGLTWLRAWVHFDNGVWMGSVGMDKLVGEAEWPAFQKRRAEDTAKPKEAASTADAPVAAASGGEDGAQGGGGNVPAHLLERSRQARQRKAAG